VTPRDFAPERIVPSTRDLLRVLTTKRKSLALVALLDEGDAAAEAERLDALDVAAFACSETGPAMAAAAAATRSPAMLALALATDVDACHRSRFFGADGVCLAPSSPWSELADAAKATRMVPIARVSSVAEAQQAAALGARAVVLLADEPTLFADAARVLPRNVTLVAWLAAPTAETLRVLLGVADAAIVPAALHRAADFADLLRELDP
jgi:hypothetical protein